MSEISEKAIKLIKDLRRDISIDIMFTPEKNAEDNSLKALTAYIAELEAAQRWIPVSERLPEGYVKVIAFAKDCMNVDWVLPEDLREVGKGAFARLYNVTHWMPLPESPEVQA